MYYSFEPKELSISQVHQFLLSGVAPRPIAFVSTISDDGVNNLAPFSFFNAFGANPPMVAFSAARRGTNGTLKDTYHNLKANGECVIHSVSHQILEQVNLASCDYPADVDEFKKAGFTPIDSDIVKPKRVKESFFHMECKLFQMIELGEENGAGNLAICQVVKIHVNKGIISDGKILPNLIDLVGRNGQEYYTRASGDAIFEVRKPGGIKGIGFDNLPKVILKSNVLTANNAAQMALVNSIPDFEYASAVIKVIPEIAFDSDIFLNNLRLNRYQEMAGMVKTLSNSKTEDILHYKEHTIKAALSQNDVDFAWNFTVWAFGIK